MDKTTVFNLALSRLGHTEYVENSGNMRICELCYPCAIARANAKYNWSFAAKRTTLTPTSSTETESSFTYPSDCLTYISLINNDTNRAIDDPRRIGSTIVTERCSSLTITYTSSALANSQTLPYESYPEYGDGVINLLAALIAPTITGQPQNLQLFLQLAEQDFLAAITRAAKEQAGNKRNPVLRMEETALVSPNRRR